MQRGLSGSRHRISLITKTLASMLSGGRGLESPELRHLQVLRGKSQMPHHQGHHRGDLRAIEVSLLYHAAPRRVRIGALLADVGADANPLINNIYPQTSLPSLGRFFGSYTRPSSDKTRSSSLGDDSPPQKHEVECTLLPQQGTIRGAAPSPVRGWYRVIYGLASRNLACELQNLVATGKDFRPAQQFLWASIVVCTLLSSWIYIGTLVHSFEWEVVLSWRRLLHNSKS